MHAHRGSGFAHRGPWWLPGGQAQTIWPALASRRYSGPAPRWRRERWATPDQDFIDVDFLLDAPPAGAVVDHAAAAAADVAPEAKPAAPLLVMFHGLEGSSASHYAQAFAAACRAAGWAMAVPHFRGCSGELNRAPRAYHSGDYEEIGWILQRLRQRHGRPLRVVGISLGGNALMRWAEEAGAAASGTASAVAAVCSPLDLTAAGHAIGRGFNRLVYTRMFLATLKPRALARLARHPGLFDRAAMLASRDLYEFDDVVTAPLHGFAGTDDYWARASAKPHLHRIRIPALCLNPRNDPFVPAASLPRPGEVGDWVTLWQPPHGGHVGFAGGALPPGHLAGMPQAVMDWLAAA